MRKSVSAGGTCQQYEILPPGGRDYGQSKSLLSTNYLLDNLPASELCRLTRLLGCARLARGEILEGDRGHQRRIWFPETCVVSLIIDVGTNSSATVGVVGREGVANDNVARQVIQVPGTARFLLLSAKQAALDAAPHLESLLLLHGDAVRGQVMQVAACNALHPADARLARFLLSVADRVRPGTVLPLTQEDLAHALGLRRSTVNANATAFQRMGLIRYQRGTVEIHNRTGLMTAACGCYGAMRLYYERLLGTVW